MFSTHVDFTLPGVLPLVFERTWTSTSSIVGELGHGWHHGFDMAIRRRQGARGWVLRLADGRLAEFAAPASGHSTLNVAEGMQLWSDGRQLWATNFDGMRYEFGPRCGDGSRRLTAIRDANANAISLQRDGAGNLTAIRAAGGQRLTVRRDEHNRIAGIDGPDPAGAGTMTLVAFEYDQSGDLTGTRDAAGAGFRYGYAAHLLTEIRWPAGATFRFRYDDPAKARSARCVETSGEAELFLRRFDYDLAARTTTVRDSRGATRVYEWNEAGRVTGRTDGLGRRTAFAYDTHQRLTRETRPDGATRQWQFDEFGRLVARRDFDAAETSVAYAPPFPGAPISRQPARVVEPGNRTHIFAYDSRGNLVDYLDPAGRRRRYLRATSGLPLAVLDALGVRQRFEWTRDGRLARESTARGMRTEFAYDHLGRLVASRRAGEQPTRYVRDAVGDVVEIVRPTGGRVRLAYDAEHQVTLHRDATGNETRWDYDGLPYPSRRFNPDGTSIQYHYDSDLNLIGLTNAKNESYTLTYDLAGQLVEEVGFDGRRQRYEYDAAGQLTAHHDAESRGARYRRDAAGRLLERVFADGTRDRFAYDAAGRLTQAANAHRDVAFSYGRGGELLEERQDNWVLRHDYDTRGRRTATELPDGRTITVDWGEDDAFTAISFGGRSVVAVERDLAGRETGRRAGAVTSASAYDPQGRLIRQSAYRGAARERVLERGYEYDAADRLIAIDDLHRGMRRYQYNPCDRLVGVSGDNPESFVFDPAGNILGSAGQSGGVATGDRLLMLGDRKFEYDGCGNRVREVRGAGGGVAVSYAYGPDNQLVAVEERDRRGHRRTEFAYDALGRRIGKTHRAVGPGAANDGARGAAVLAEARTWFLWDGDRLLAEASGPVTAEEPADALETLYLHEPGTFRPAALVRHGRAGAADQVYHYHLDRLGTPQEVTNDNGQVAWQATLKAWGGVAAVSVAEVENPLRFQGQYHDAETGLHYNRFRYYSPSEGRFVHEDPIRLSGGSNLAAYAANPLQWIDPLGLACTRGMGGRALSQSQQAEFDAFGARAKSAGLVENPNRTGSWGRIGESGKYEEVARIDVGEPGAPGWGGKTHIHIDGGEDHLPLDTPIPGEP